MKHQTTSGILYVRAGIKPFRQEISHLGGVLDFLHKYWSFQEVVAPYFRRTRAFWEKAPEVYLTNSGALGKILKAFPGVVQSQHPTHSFVGLGSRVTDILQRHNHTKSCFYPMKELAEQHDFSMLLLGCVDESPGFSTVHATQFELGLSQKHLIRFILRWDYEIKGSRHSKMAIESPGCSLSFGKFYEEYEQNGNLVRGELCDSGYIFIPSARSAMAAERKILGSNPRFVDCGNRWCTTCRLRLY